MTEPKPATQYATTRDEADARASELERTWATYWSIIAHNDPPYKSEYKFVPDRDWRFDVCWPDAAVYVELDGGTYSGGRHVRGKGYRNDCEKQNRAVSEGWLPFRFTSDMLRDDPISCVLMVEAAIEERRG